MDHSKGKLRAQLFSKEDEFTLWVVESSEEIYTVNFNSILSVDVYKVEEKDLFKAIFLFRDDDEDFNLEIGLFNSYEDAITFLTWIKKTLGEINKLH